MHRSLRLILGMLLLALIYSPSLWAGAHNVDPFCDTTFDHGSSASCKEEAEAKGLLKCDNGYKPVNVNCSVPQECANGHWCKCSYDCAKSTIADPDIDADGDGNPDTVPPVEE